MSYKMTRIFFQNYEKNLFSLHSISNAVSIQSKLCVNFMLYNIFCVKTYVDFSPIRIKVPQTGDGIPNFESF